MNGNGENHSFNLGNPIDVATLLVNKINALPETIELIKRDAEADTVTTDHDMIGDVLTVLATVVENQLVIMAVLQAVAIPAAQQAQQRAGGIIVPNVAPFPRKVQ